MRTLLTVLALALPAGAQQASYTLFGEGCVSASATLGATGVPQLGSSFTVHYSGPNFVGVKGLFENGAHPWLLTGFSNTTWGAIPLPLLLPRTPLGVRCELLVSPDLVLPMPRLGSRYQDSLTFPVPNEPSLIGLVFHQQWLVYHFTRLGAGGPLLSASFQASNGGTATVGS